VQTVTGERAAHLAEVAAVLWPAPATVAVGRHPASPGTESYLVLPRAADPRLVLPADRLAAAAAVRRYSAHRSARAAARAGLLAAALAAGAGPLLLRDRVVVRDPGSSLVARLREVLGADLVVSLHLGPPRANRKPVLQLLTRRGAPVGFAKLGVNELTRRLVNAEAAALRSLAAAPLGTVEVPRVLHHGTYGEVAVLVQSALPVWEGARTVDPAVRVAAMREVATHAGVRTEAVGDSEWGRELAARLDKVAAPAAREQLGTALAGAADRRLPLGGWHGDWTPWNMTVRAGRALVWDWERFTVGVPVGFDAVHYALQAALWRRGADPREATSRLLAGAPALLAPFGLDPVSAAAVARLYLVEIGTRYLLDGQAAAGARLGRVERWLLPALRPDDRGRDDTAGAAATPPGKDGST
jgi:hypothetical protein